jgi:hypothetical protein
MRILTRRATRLLGAALVSTLGLAAANAATVTTTTTAHADPAWLTSLSGVGSDTLQWWFDGLAGGPVGPGCLTYTPMSHVNSLTTALETISSFDAVSYTTDCGHVAYTVPSSIATKVNSPLFDRPNGSGAGRNALNDQATNISWQTNPSATGGAVPLGSSIDFVRSSSINTAAGIFVYIPVAQDAVTYAVYCGAGVAAADCTAAQTLPTATLTALYGNNSGYLSPTGNPQPAGHPTWSGGATLQACTLNTGSGTYGFWGTVLGDGSAATMDGHVSATGCGAVAVLGKALEENDLDTWLGAAATPGTAAGQDSTSCTNGGTATNCIWVVPFSMGQVICQHNGICPPSSNTALAAAGVHIGLPNDLTTTNQALPYCTSTGPPAGSSDTCPNLPSVGNWAPQRAFYQSAFGRYLYVFALNTAINTAPPVPGLRDLFKGAGSAICNLGAGQATHLLFGFDDVTTQHQVTNATGCGDSTTFALKSN